MYFTALPDVKINVFSSTVALSPSRNATRSWIIRKREKIQFKSGLAQQYIFFTSSSHKQRTNKYDFPDIFLIKIVYAEKREREGEIIKLHATTKEVRRRRKPVPEGSPSSIWGNFLVGIFGRLESLETSFVDDIRSHTRAARLFGLGFCWPQTSPHNGFPQRRKKKEEAKIAKRKCYF